MPSRTDCLDRAPGLQPGAFVSIVKVEGAEYFARVSSLFGWLGC